jgi:hypothetical protein
MMDSVKPPETYEFDLQVMDTNLAPDKVRQLVQKALAEAITAAKRDGVAIEEVKAEIPGAFGGEIVVVILLLLEKVVEKFAGGVAEEAGKHFYDAYLKPRLEDLKLYPSSLKRRRTGAKKS